jgi:hypothetical protein
VNALRRGSLLVPGLLSGLLLTASPVSAGDAAPRPAALVGRSYVFPSSANAQGQFGAYFKTKLTLYNPNADAITVRAVLSTPTGPSSTVNIALSANSFTRWENFLDEKFGYTGGAGINLAESTATKSFVAVAEVYTESDAGRYTTPVTGLLADDAVVTLGNPVASPISVVAGLRVDAANRANFGCSSASADPVRIRADFYAFRSFVRTATTSATLDLVPRGWAQAAVPVEGEDIIVTFWIVSGTPGAGVYCYGVNVNNASNDGTSVPARTWAP